MATGELSPILKGAVADLEVSIIPALLKVGATSHTIVANNWDSAEELVNELAFDAPTYDVTTVWSRCESLCARRARVAEVPPQVTPVKPSRASSSTDLPRPGKPSGVATKTRKSPAFV